MTVLRYWCDPPATGAENMAIDEALWKCASMSDTPIMRFYEWAPATVSIGYFQASSDRALHAASRDAAWVRRHTGGGAIIHDRELTYCLVFPADRAEKQNAGRLYAEVHAALQRVLATHRVQLEIGDAGESSQSFLCFQRRGRYDGFVAGHKVLGSAQRRGKRALLQHGSLLWQRSTLAPELPGLLDLTAIAGLTPEKLAEAWVGECAEAFGIAIEPSELSEIERSTADKIRYEKYATSAWNLRR